LDRAIAVYRKGNQRFEDAGRANPALKAHALNRYSLYEGLAPALQAIGDPTEAIPFYRKLIERNPNNSQRYLDLGRALLQTKGQPAKDEAPAYGKALDLYPGSVAANVVIGLGLAYHGDRRDALAVLQKAIRIVPTTSRRILRSPTHC